MPTQEILKLGSIPVDAVVTLEVTGAFYMRLHQLLINKSAEKTPEEFALLMKELKVDAPKDAYEHDLSTLLMLVLTIEENAQKQGKIKSIDHVITVDDEKK